MSHWQGPPPGPDPQDPYGHNPYGPPPQGPYGPEQPGPYGPGPGPGPQGPYGPGLGPYGAPQQQPYPPPPRSSNAAIFWVIGVVAVVAVLGVIVTAVVLLSSGSDKTGTVAGSAPLPAATSLPSQPTFTSDPATPTPAAPTGPADLSGVLTPTVKAALRGNTYTRLSTRRGSCASNANSALRKVLKAHPCSVPVAAALYTNPGKSVRVSVYIMQFASSSDAAAISNATNSQASPPLISAPRRGVGYWTLSRTQGSRVVYAVACRSDGGAAGASTGTVNSAAKELGVEIATVLIWKS
ncbi:MAG: hypothetical protein QOE54_4971 [Streptosporangiaceae bacterium]|jgi:hypothetical protein|nr:hypothetical protein [Streptosporangiaceae bacterium]